MTINAGIGMMGPDEGKNRGLAFRRPRATINPMRETVSYVVDAEIRCAGVAGVFLRFQKKSDVETEL